MKALTVSILAAAIGGAVLCPICESKVADARPTASVATAQATDTATVRLHISGMTCGTCPVTARKALGKLAGVYSATVTLTDSLGVVKFNPAKLKPAAIAAHLTKMTGYGAKVLADTVKGPRQGARS
jgi:periplasmic mercuric ion binding protein